MNYLAHLFLSGTDEEVLIGNFMGDYVKGQAFNNFSERIKRGILLHRFIDYYTDTHTIVRASKSRFTKQYGKYSGILVDIIYDHFLCANWGVFSNEGLEGFIHRIHQTLQKYVDFLPQPVQQFVPAFINNNWLETYRTTSGIATVLSKMSRRTSLPDHTDFAMEVLRNEYDFIDEEFMTYFPQLIDFVKRKYNVQFE